MNRIERVHKVYNNVLNMLTNRGYTIPSSLTTSFELFKKKYIKDDFNIFVTHTTPVHTMCVVFNLHTKNKLQNIKQLLTDIYETHSIDTDRVILILNNKPNNVIKKFICSSLYKDKVELFWLSILQIDITTHSLQPKFILLSEDEKKALLDKYDIKVQQLPKLPMQDPICRHYKYPKHSVVKIIRNSRESISTEFYRHVA